MSEREITLKKQRLPFTQVPNELLCNGELSSVAKALWCLLFSRPDDWTFYWSEILKNMKEGRDAVKKAAKQLEEFGYLRRSQKKISINGKLVFGGMEIELFLTPTLEYSGPTPVTEIQSTEIQSTEIPSTESQSTNKEIKKKDLFNKQRFISLPEEEKKEILKSIWKEGGLKSDLEKYIKFRARNDWKGFSNLKKDCEWWEDGFKTKNPSLYKTAAISKKDRTREEIEQEKNVNEIKSLIKGEVCRDNEKGYLDYSKYFELSELELEGKGSIIFVKDEKALKYRELLNKINVETIYYEKSS